MKGFALDENGDILIKNNEIQMVTGTDLTVQTVKTVLSTNKGEWTFNEDEGVNFANILGKNANEETTRIECEDGLSQVDEDFVINAYKHTVSERSANVLFSFKDGDTETEVQTKWD